jgi:tetratricopeptide (TPR) repeat protein
LFRRGLVGALLLALLCASGLSLRADEPALFLDQPAGRIEQPISAPLALARMYAAGQRAEAIARLEGWGEDELKRELDALRELTGKVRGRGPEGTLRAAVMLHTDREAFERMQAPVAERARECGIEKHGAHARALISLLVVRSDRSRDFARRWLTAMALQSHRDWCLNDVTRWTHEGLKWFPKDAQMLLIQGTAGEVAGALPRPPAFFYANPSEQKRGLAEVARQRQELSQARRDLEAALAVGPELHEARLRLGRVLWRLEKPGEARAALQGVLERAQEPWLLHLGHLFLGRVLEESGDLAAAAEHYRAALAIDPGAQAAAMALSQALLLTGDDGEGRKVLGRAIAQAPRDQPRDAYMTYHLGRSHLAQAMLDGLRAETLE